MDLTAQYDGPIPPGLLPIADWVLARFTMCFGRVLEGSCPLGHGALERRETDGFCNLCLVGYSVHGRTIAAECEVARVRIVSDDGRAPRARVERWAPGAPGDP